MRSVELFAGCGGLALGVARAGFQHAMVIECDPQASATLSANKSLGTKYFADWPLVKEDICNVSYHELAGKIDLVAGGPPCQPFSIGGKHRGASDERNMWPEAIRAVRQLRPKAFLFENVRGLLRPAFQDYLEFLRLQLSWPGARRKGRETWKGKLRRLQARERENVDPTYHVAIAGINAADYGAPQKRHRAIIMGVRFDIASELVFPEPTHSREALVWSQRVVKNYWERHDICPKARPAMTEQDRRILKQLRATAAAPARLPWVTVRDAIGDLPRPTISAEPIPGHRLHPGARVYPRHTGSVWDEPAKALKAGDHGVPGGENILAPANRSVRYFTIREMARLQGFPDDYLTAEGWKNPIKQLGNAVPVQVGYFFAQELKRIIELAAESAGAMAKAA